MRIRAEVDADEEEVEEVTVGLGLEPVLQGDDDVGAAGAEYALVSPSLGRKRG